jgi:hypothetical protein
LAKIAAIAVLSTTPVLVAGDASEGATGIGRVPANVGGPTRVEPGTDGPQTGGPTTGIRDHAVAVSAPTDGTSPSTGGPADVDGAPGLSAVVPALAEDATTVDSVVGDIEPALTLPALATVTLPTTPAIQVPPITLGPITLPPITVPPITVPAITLPPITVPPITVPPITLPPIGPRANRTG